MIAREFPSWSTVASKDSLPKRSPSGRTAAKRPTRSSSSACPARARRGVSEARSCPAPHRQAILHRQAPEQLAVRAIHPAGTAEREDHRRAPSPAGLLLLELPPAV